MAGLLDGEKDNYYKDLKSRFDYLSHKYQRERKVYSSKFSFLSIDQIIFQQYDFPSWQAYHFEHNLFSKIAAVILDPFMHCLKLALRITEEHYQFDKSPVKKKVFRNHLSI
jgi:hypothetical protein